ncbi:50S ribosomal protein L22 [bacterium]|nr:MAG: 50S ribosomal protein L22 [candidate division KSB1 bacterium]MCE7942301.1 50S ribosomal protein L22 [Chlorobi bacterium CHB1]MCL4705136.1 50S ribosomal protein L22 [bacterium]MDL1876268.1 50S ribosomal protein L22 [Cytophagia bacterium CHB2]MBC6947879.1 50S ribosomal protein L22 [candidate division KSB1 bacterium]
MEARAKLRYLRMSPRKVRRVIDLVRGKGVEEALNILHFTRKRAALPIEKTIRSAVANYIEGTETKKADTEDLFVMQAFVDGGFTMKRFRAGSMGRASRIRKRSCHITVVVSDGEAVEQQAN